MVISRSADQLSNQYVSIVNFQEIDAGHIGGSVYSNKEEYKCKLGNETK